MALNMRVVIVSVVLLLLFGAAAAYWALPSVWNAPEQDALSDVAKAPESEEVRSPAESSPPSESTPNKETAAKPEQKAEPANKKDSPFDIATIDPGGTSVFAGRSEPNGHVTVFANGKPVGSANTDAYGEWVLVTEDKVPSDDPELTVKFSAGPATDNTRVAEAQADEATDANKPKATPEADEAAGKVTAELVDNLRRMVERERVQRDDTAAKPVREKPTPLKAAASPLESTTPVGADAPTSEHTNRKPVEADLPKPGDVVPEAKVPAVVVKETKGEQTELQSVPVPIKFVFNKPVLTKEGRETAELLAEYVQLKKFSSLELTGHADERGRHEYNLALSSQRLQQVAAMLREAGYSGKLRLIPKGETEPFTGVDRSKFSEDVLYELDRRVELRAARP